MQELQLSNESLEPLVYIIAININYNLTALTLVFVEIRIQQGLPHIYCWFLSVEPGKCSTTSTGTPLDSAVDGLATRVLCALNCAVSTPAPLSTCRSHLARVFLLCWPVMYACASAPRPLAETLLHASSSPLPGAVFTESSHTLSATCVFLPPARGSVH